MTSEASLQTQWQSASSISLYWKFAAQMSCYPISLNWAIDRDPKFGLERHFRH